MWKTFILTSFNASNKMGPCRQSKGPFFDICQLICPGRPSKKSDNCRLCGNITRDIGYNGLSCIQSTTRSERLVFLSRDIIRESLAERNTGTGEASVYLGDYFYEENLCHCRSWDNGIQLQTRGSDHSIRMHLASGRRNNSGNQYNHQYSVEI